MRYFAPVFIVFVLSACAHLQEASSVRPLPPSEAYPELFKRVALTELYEPKNWTDVRPLRPVADIERDYRAKQPMDENELAAFVFDNFEPPRDIEVTLELPADRDLGKHIEALWPVLIRSPEEAGGHGTLLPLPYEYIVPGGRFREAYYWDTYFTMLGLTGPHFAVRKSVVDNFAWALDTYGRIPNGNRSYYLSRSQPPFFYLMVSLLDEDDPAAAWADYLDALMAEHRFWTSDAEGLLAGDARGRSVALVDGAVLQRYFDDKDTPRDESYRYDIKTAEEGARPPSKVYRDIRAAAESGWDFSSRWFGAEGTLASTMTTNIVPVDLNALLYGLERAIALGCARSGDTACANQFKAHAAARREAVHKHLWNPAGYFADYDLLAGEVRSQATAAMLYPVFTGLAESGKAQLSLETFTQTLVAPGGVLPTSRVSGEQWDAPNGWAPHQWIAVQSAESLGRAQLAEDLADRWMRTVARSFCESGKLSEKYDVVNRREGGGGEYPNQDGFGWTNGVFTRLSSDYPALRNYADTVPASEDERALCGEI